MAENGPRPILPNGSGNTNFTFINAAPEPNKTNFIFVDDNNKHTRHKVMRACVACRHKKTKCDAATSNSWPCGACIKHNIKCIPPSSDNDSEGASPFQYQSLDPRQGSSVGDDSLYGFDEASPYSPPLMGSYDKVGNVQSLESPQFVSNGTLHPQSLNIDQTRETQQANMAFTDSSWNHEYMLGNLAPSVDLSNFHGSEHTSPPSIAKTQSVDSRSWSNQPETHDISDNLGQLKITSTSVAPYIAADQLELAGVPAIEEPEVELPKQPKGKRTVEIPPEMMPSDAKALEYFRTYFTHIHPYIPVLDKTLFYHQWQTKNLSPLVLEGIFACASNLLLEPKQRDLWLALASRHEESFKDVPRLSTIQGLIILLKAREAVPIRGYYYRSWTTIQYLISMAKDLNLNDHSETHLQGLQDQLCGSSQPDCAVKIRIWHTLFNIEMMVGGPQGRTTFVVNLNTVDLNAPRSNYGLEESDLRISQDHIQFVRVIYNIRQTSKRYAELNKKKLNWATDPSYTQHNSDFQPWIQNLPHHLQIIYPKDNSPPRVPFHFVANIHSYHWLSVIMQHRPQLEMVSSVSPEDYSMKFKICYEAATKICRLHEAILNQWGFESLLCMVRGINFTIFAALTCTLFHLAAITSPDPELNADSKNFFTRHMRLLERCSIAWPMPAMQIQIDSLRQAFTTDMDKPFELRTNFPGSPGAHTASTPSIDMYDNFQSSSPGNQTGWLPNAINATMLTPPTTAEGTIGSGHSDASYSGHHGDVAQNANDMNDAINWDPSGVFA